MYGTDPYALSNSQLDPYSQMGSSMMPSGMMGNDPYNASSMGLNPYDQQQPNAGEADALIAQLAQMNGAQDDPNFDPTGWRRFYPIDDHFFNFDHGTTYPDQVQVVSPENLDNCQVYIGEMNAAGERHGFGVLHTADCIRRGDFRNGQFSGWGREAKSDGDVIIGRFENGYLNGLGIYQNYKGNTYTGDFIDSNRTGLGELTTGRFIYNGQFRDNKLDGKGRIEWFNEGNVYEGDFVQNEINGVGVFRWKNGDLYEGQFIRGQMNGKGRYIHSNGQVYEGDYINGIKQGMGRLIYPDGTILEGNFVNGLPNGPANFTIGGKQTPVTFNNGKIVR